MEEWRAARPRTKGPVYGTRKYKQIGIFFTDGRLLGITTDAQSPAEAISVWLKDHPAHTRSWLKARYLTKEEAMRGETKAR